MGLDGLADQEGWHLDAGAARVHYDGEGDRYSIEYYEPTATVLYWRIVEDGDSAVPVPRSDVPIPLRERIRLDLDAADIDPAIERETV